MNYTNWYSIQSIRCEGSFTILWFTVELYFQTGEKSHSCKHHTKAINDLQLSADMSMVIAASKDHTAKVSYYE